MPNYINIKIEELYLFTRVYYTLFIHTLNLIKTQILSGVDECNVLHIDIVWRLSGFAFFVRFTSVAALFYFGVNFMYSCTFIGHADCDESIKENLYIAIEKLINEYNVTVFYVGTHGNFDYYVYKTLCELEKIYKIEVFVVLSHLTQVPEYIKGAKTVFPDTVAKSPYKYAIIKRNRYMIEKSEFLICYINHTFSNTYNFVKFATGKNKHIINLGGNKER